MKRVRTARVAMSSRVVLAVMETGALVAALAAFVLALAWSAAVAAALSVFALACLGLGAWALRRWREPVRTERCPDGTLAIRDVDTGLHVEWYLRLRAHEELRRSSRHGFPLTVVSLWSDDEAQFRRLAATLRTQLRAGELAAPFGHLHIVCLLPGTSALGAMGMVARVLSEAGVRAQVGVAQTHGPDDLLGDLLERARHGRTSLGPMTPRLKVIRKAGDDRAGSAR